MKDYILLSDLMTAVSDTLYDGFGDQSFRILAEVTDVKVYYNRSYAFLNLVQKSGSDIVASASAVIWRDHFHIIKEFEKATGTGFNQNLELVLEVKLQFHNRYGLRISIVGIDASFALGKLEKEKQHTLNSLVTEYPDLVWVRDGEYRSANQILKLPMVMQHIALIAAPGSDGRRDFLHELENNLYGIDYRVTEFAAQVQGEAAIGQISAQLERIKQANGAFQAVCMVRGGGSNTDFSAFDSFKVALAVADCPIPIFTGIGHERNVSITDLLCHSPQKTPTKCAAGITDHNIQFLAFVQNAADDIQKRALRLMDNFKVQIHNTEQNLLKSAQWSITKQRQWLQHQLTHLDMANPGNTLQRGFALVYKNQQHIGSGGLLKSGDPVSIRFKDTTLKATIE
jgi:exodeoxyribonuclease VII large subunit